MVDLVSMILEEYEKMDNDVNIDIDPREIEMGIEVEKEHTSDYKERKKIAMDHLKEDPQYYTKLKNAGINGESIVIEGLEGYKAYTTFKSIPIVGKHRPVFTTVIFSRNTRINEKPYRVTLFDHDRILTHIDLDHIPHIDELNDPWYQQRVFKWIKDPKDTVQFTQKIHQV